MVSDLFDRERWRPVAGFDDLHDVTYGVTRHRPARTTPVWAQFGLVPHRHRA